MQVVIFSKSYCPYCHATKELFKGINVHAEVFELDAMSDGDAIQNHLREMTGQRTVPNIFVKGNHIGGNSEAQVAYTTGKLENMLKED